MLAKGMQPVGHLCVCVAYYVYWLFVCVGYLCPLL